MVRISALLQLLVYASFLLGAGPLYLFLDLPVRLLLPAALAAGIYCDRRGRHPLSGHWGTLAAIGCFAVYALQVSAGNLVEPAANALALLLALRLVTEKSPRHILQIFVLSLFSLAASSLLTLSIGFFAWLIALVAVVTVGLVLLSFQTADPNLSLDRARLRQVLGVAALLPAVSLVLMLIFFVILPRTQRPLWNALNPTETASVGFTDKVQPGAFASTAAARTIAFRVESPPLSPEQRYWRGIVLNRIEGNTWVRTPPPAGEISRVSAGQTVSQTVYPEPRTDGYLFALDVPRSVSGMRAEASGDLVYTTRRAIDRRARFEASSLAGGSIQAAGRIDRDFYTQVPAPPSPRLAELAAEVRAAGAAPSDRIARLEAFFRAQQLAYATTDLPRSADPVEEFLFEKKRGYCEFFASAFALVLRHAGVPARLVGGFYGGEYNQLGGYYLVSDDAAHVWVEALVEGERWLRIDPSTLAGNASEALLAGRSRGLSLGRRLADSMNYFWNQAVVSYDLGSQIELLRQANRRVSGLRFDFDLRQLAVPVLAVAAACGLLLMLVRRRRETLEARLLRRYLRQAARAHGLEKIPSGEGLYELAERLDDERCRRFARIYGGAVYRDRQLTEAEREELKGLIEELQRTPRRG